MIDWNEEELKAKGYKINNRELKDVQDILEHYQKFRLPTINFRSGEIFYTGAEHRGNPKLPNKTKIHNHICHPHGALVGTTCGHLHTQCQKKDGRPFQEIYEFLTHGAMFLRGREYAELVFLEPGEKVIVRTDENMALFNMGEEPLLTLDYANPEMNGASKELEKEAGPGMMIWRSDYDLTFRTNPDYYERGILQGWRNSVTVRTKDKGAALYCAIKQYRHDFADMGINLVFGGNIPKKYCAEFAKPLVQLVDEKNPELFEALEMS